MPDYGRYCPVALGTEVLADRWTPLVLRELLLGNTRFNDIARGLPGISRTLLSQRLRHLQRVEVVERWEHAGNPEYRLTPAGRALEPVVLALGRWAVEWRFDELHPDEVDPVTLTWWMHRRVDVERLPPGRVVLELRHTEPRRQVLWMVFDRQEPSVCVQHPGFETDITVTSSTPVLADVFAGARTWAAAVADDAIHVDGPPTLVRALPQWFLWSPFAATARERAERGVPAPISA